ncbi:hypothetical protein PanWU01x14_036860 [Parasponia andersonii]|uniref:Uncharacterized protein n=1 Tax=Parasponia andersonii TaxID=3476 RepID=A0A2P5DSL3_PARAD|nr:hypothetical protein PanWU01x14_036860 [Parasponia andersonii]
MNPTNSRTQSETMPENQSSLVVINCISGNRELDGNRGRVAWVVGGTRRIHQRLDWSDSGQSDSTSPWLPFS